MIYCICGHPAYNHVVGYFTGRSICEDCFDYNNFHHEFKQDNLKYLEWCVEQKEKQNA
jgi:hypothetical protein